MRNRRKFSEEILISVANEIDAILAVAKKHAEKAEISKMERKIHQAKVWARDFNMRIERKVRKVLQQIPSGDHLNIHLKL